jgi:hypothetical protein
MPVTTYLDVQPLERVHPFGLSDSEVAETLQELRAATQKDWVIRESINTQQRFLQSSIITTQYKLFVGIEGSEYQQINFYDPSSKSPFPRPVDATLVMAYMIGYLAGSA